MGSFADKAKKDKEKEKAKPIEVKKQFGGKSV